MKKAPTKKIYLGPKWYDDFEIVTQITEHHDKVKIISLPRLAFPPYVLTFEVYEGLDNTKTLIELLESALYELKDLKDNRS